MQNRSGGLKETPDEFVITSLDVIIHHDRKLGTGGFAEVFEGDWRGTRVAVKTLEKGVPASVCSIVFQIYSMPNVHRHRLSRKK